MKLPVAVVSVSAGLGASCPIVAVDLYAPRTWSDGADTLRPTIWCPST